MAPPAKTINNVPSRILANAWVPQILQYTDMENKVDSTRLVNAVERTLPLLEDGPESVPFVCRYRTEIIHPLTPRQVHVLQSLLEQHASLSSLRSKVLQVLPTESAPPTEVLTSVSKSELEDWYAPYKPPSKGSILQRIQEQHPELVRTVDDLWERKATESTKLPLQQHRQELVHLIAGKIAAEPKVMSLLMDELTKHCRIHTTALVAKAAKDNDGEKKRIKTDSSSSQEQKYTHYHDFRRHLMQVKDHQVLAIRRGMQEKQLSLSFDIDATKMESSISYHLRFQSLAPPILWKQYRELLQESIHDAWTRLLRRRGTGRLWTAKCQQAQERAYQVFQDNLERALLAPPFHHYHRPQKQPKQQSKSLSPFLLALDPGFQAGMKCALLDFQGEPQRLDTVHFLGPRRNEAVNQLVKLLQTATGRDETNCDKRIVVVVALGNGHGSQDCRKLVEEASLVGQIPVDVHMVNEAGASVWSVTEAAQREFPQHTPVAIAAISIGRRLLNPLFELVKVPPKSLGLGMYQHDLNDKELEQRLHLVGVHAVATVGVDLNACSLEILEKIPGLAKLGPKLMKARPWKRRADLLQISGLGPDTFQNCAAFCRIHEGIEPLDATIVHPESYELARWILRQLSWKLNVPIPSIPPRDEWRRVWSKEIDMASTQFDVSPERVLAVMDNLIDSINKVDPRTKDLDTNQSDPTLSLTQGCSGLPADLADPQKLMGAMPVRGIVGTIRNISDFGAFIDFGGHNDGLLHKSKLGLGMKLEHLLIGQQIGVDILDMKGDKVSLGLHGTTPLVGEDKGGQQQLPSSSTAASTSRKRKR